MRLTNMYMLWIVLAVTNVFGVEVINYTYKGYINDITFVHDTAWVATTGGVVVYNSTGEALASYVERDGLASNRVHAVEIAPDADKWFATDNGVSRLKDGMWTTYTVSNSGLRGNEVLALDIADDGTVWAGTRNGRVCIFNGTTWTAYDIDSSEWVMEESES